MSEIRPLRHGDIDALAALFQHVFRRSGAPAPAQLAAYLRRLYLDMPGTDPEIASLVHVDDTGVVNGFIGVTALNMRHGDRTLRAAICGSLMSRDRDRDPMVGARLLKAFLAGPQDLSFSETASEVSARMWTGLRGIALPAYSLDWFRVIRPAGFIVDAARSRLGAARHLAPLARGLDRLSSRRSGGDTSPRWFSASSAAALPGGLAVKEIDRAGFADLVEPLTQHFALRPAWAEGQLDAILADAESKPAIGAPVFARVETAKGVPVGAFAYHLTPGRIGRTLQILARPGQAGPVIDALVADAAARGAAGLRGRTQPALLEAMLGRRISFIHLDSTVVHSRDPEIVRICREGGAFLNGIAGEHWSRLLGGGLD